MAEPFDDELRLEVDETRCAISVRNTGIGFDASVLEGTMPGVDSGRGRGVAIMRSVMDRVEFESESESGTIVHLVKTLTVDSDAVFARLHRPAKPPE